MIRELADRARPGGTRTVRRLVAYHGWTIGVYALLALSWAPPPWGQPGLPA